MLLETQDAHERRWKRYPAYRDSGVEWLGAVPENWQVERLRFHISINPTKSEVRKLAPDTTVSFIPMESVGEYGGICLDQTRPIEDVSAGYTYFQEGDVVVAKITPCFENVKRAVVKGLTNGIGFGTTELHVLRPNYNINRYFLFYLTLSYDFRKLGESEMYGSAGQKRVPEEFIKNLKHPIPSLPEQRTIAAFLDHETGRIDALVAKKERQIGLLQEKRTALISHAVTKGLDPDAPMKDSGVEWLGEVPEHWAKMRIKHLLHQIIDTEHKTAPYSPDGNYLVVRTANVRNGILSFDDAKYTDSEGFKEWTRRGVPKPGDILFTREAPAGEACIVPDNVPLCIGQRMVLFRVNKQRLDARFGIYSIYGGLADEFIRSLSQGSTVEHFNMSDIGNTPLFEPSLSEQRAIAAFLDRETGRIDALTTKVHESISKLHEYRTAFISAAVTGKIDVRGELVS